MFLLRSIFWLTLAFVVMAPKDVDLQQRAGQASAQAMAAGQKLIVEQILSADCSSIECMGGKALLAVTTSSTPSVADTPMQDRSAKPVPFPRPRPAWAG